MGFWSSYKRLPRYQRVFIGVSGMLIGWYGPSWMSYLFIEPGVLRRQEAPPPSSEN